MSIDADNESITVDDEAGSFTTGTDLARPDWLDPTVPFPDDFAIDSEITVGEIRAVRGVTEVPVDGLAAFYRDEMTALGWSVDHLTVQAPDFFQIFLTSPAGDRLDIEFVQGKLGFVTGRARPGD